MYHTDFGLMLNTSTNKHAGTTSTKCFVHVYVFVYVYVLMPLGVGQELHEFVLLVFDF